MLQFSDLRVRVIDLRKHFISIDLHRPILAPNRPRQLLTRPPIQHAIQFRNHRPPHLLKRLNLIVKPRNLDLSTYNIRM